MNQLQAEGGFFVADSPSGQQQQQQQGAGLAWQSFVPAAPSMALLRWCAAIVACCHCVSAALVPSDIVSTLAFANGTVVDASPLVRMALAGAPDGQGFSPSYALGRSGTFLYHPKATDGGDTACQGAVNVDQIGLLATPDLQPGLCLSVRPSVRLPACLSACLHSFVRRV